MKVQQLYLAENSKTYDRMESNQGQFTSTANSVLGDILLHHGANEAELTAPKQNDVTTFWQYSGD